MTTGIHRHASSGEEAKRHVHALVRINTLITNPEFRYECRACGVRLKKRRGVLKAVKTINPAQVGK